MTIAVTTDPNLPAIGVSLLRRRRPGSAAAIAPYASRRCRASTRRPATTAPRGCSTAAAYPKDDLVTEAYGTTDEAVAALGLARALTGDETMADDLLTLQRELFVVGADLATNPKERAKLDAGGLPRDRAR